MTDKIMKVQTTNGTSVHIIRKSRKVISFNNITQDIIYEAKTIDLRPIKYHTVGTIDNLNVKLNTPNNPIQQWYDDHKNDEPYKDVPKLKTLLRNTVKTHQNRIFTAKGNFKSTIYDWKIDNLMRNAILRQKALRIITHNMPHNTPYAELKHLFTNELLNDGVKNVLNALIKNGEIVGVGEEQYRLNDPNSQLYKIENRLQALQDVSEAYPDILDALKPVESLIIAKLEAADNDKASN